VHVTSSFDKNFIGGNVRAIYSINDELKKRDISSSVIHFPTTFRKIESMFKEIELIKRFIHLFFVFIFMFYSLIYISINRLKYSHLVVHSHGTNYCMYVGLLSKIVGCKTIHTFRTFDSKPINSFFVKHIDYLTATGKDIERFFIYKPPYLNRIKFIPNGADIRKFKPKKNKDIIKKRLHVPEDKFVLIFLSRLNLHKKSYGLNVVLESLDFVRKKDSNFIFLIVGDGEYKNKLRWYVTKHKLSNYVSFYPLTNKPQDFYNIADIYIESPNSTFQSIASLEAMACGLPVINCVVKGGEALKNGYNGLIVPKNPKEIAKAILYLKNNPEIRKSYSKNAIRTIRNEYRWAAVINKYIDIYTKL